MQAQPHQYRQMSFCNLISLLSSSKHARYFQLTGSLAWLSTRWLKALCNSQVCLHLQGQAHSSGIVTSLLHFLSFVSINLASCLASLASAQQQWLTKTHAASASNASEKYTFGCCHVHEPGLKLLDFATEYHRNA